MRGFAEIASPISDLLATGTRKKSKQKNNKKPGDRWMNECELAFVSIKDKLTSAPLLVFQILKYRFL